MRVRGRLEREGIYISLQLILIVIQQKLTQHLKEVSYNFKNIYYVKL